MAQKVLSLDATKKEKCLFLFSYGPKHFDLNSFSQTLEQLPDTLAQALPAQIRALLSERLDLNSLTALLQGLEVLPDSLVQNLPSHVKTLLAHRKDYSPENLSKKLLGDFFDKLRDLVPKEDIPIPSKYIGPLFHNEEHGVPESVAPLLPDLVDVYLNEVLKDGVIGNLKHLTSQPQLRAAIDWFAHQGEQFATEKSPTSFTQSVRSFA